ncbi:glycosyltransferase family 32 protein [Falsiroseomonas sp. HW251]|uniref:glycosyltransferase family 32 protein n=1 Tax=Falsiroseomonas sp. HW251 TaxID=3390998 RepID=UPI003D31C27E
MTPGALQRAERLAEQARLRDALEVLGEERAALGPEAALLAARCRRDIPDPLGALALLRQAATPAAAAATRHKALMQQGMLLAGLGRDRGAADAFHAALAIRPADRDAAFLRACALRRLGWADLALAGLRALPHPLPAWWRQQEQQAAASLAEARAEIRAGLAACRAGRAPAAEAAEALLASGRLRALAWLLAEGATRDDWLAARLVERRCWPAAWHGAGESFGSPDPWALASWRLQRGAVAEALATLAAAGPPETGPARLAEARLLVLAGRASELADRAARRLAALPRRVDLARLLLSGLLLSGRLVALRAEDLPAGPAPEAVPLVQYWHDPDPPADVAAVMQSWVARHPRHPLRRFHRASARAWLLGSRGPAVAEAFDACPGPAAEADLLRLAVLAREGGIWADADEACLRSMDGVLAALPEGGLAAWYADELPFYLHNSVLVARPGGGLAEAAFHAACAALRARRPDRPFNIWQQTGPGLLTRIGVGETAGLRVLSLSLVRHLTRGAHDLRYKFDAASDWRS